VRTNIVLFSHPNAGGFLRWLAGEGVLGVTLGPGVVRFVTHCDIDDDQIERAVKAIHGAPA